MKAFLTSLVVLATFVTACNAQCYTIDLNEAQECKDAAGVVHPLDSTWLTQNCEDCSCSKRGITCCKFVREPIGFANNCKKVFNAANCSYTVVEKSNPQKLCNVEAWIV